MLKKEQTALWPSFKERQAALKQVFESDGMSTFKGAKEIGPAKHGNSKPIQYTKGKDAFYIKNFPIENMNLTFEAMGFINEYIFGPLFKRILFSKAPHIELVTNSKIPQLSSKSLVGFNSIKQNNERPITKIKNVKRTAAVLATCLFLGDYDLNAGNVGLMPAQDGSDSYVLAKIDHGWAGSRKFTKAEIMLQDLATIVLGTGYSYFQKLTIDSKEFRETIKQIIQISDEEIEAFVSRRIDDLKKIGEVEKVEKIPIEGLQMEEWEDDTVHNYNKNLPKHFFKEDWEPLAEHFIAFLKNQRQRMLEIGRIMDVICQIDQPKGWHDQTFWIEDINQNSWIEDMNNYQQNPYFLALSRELTISGREPGEYEEIEKKISKKIMEIEEIHAQMKNQIEEFKQKVELINEDIKRDFHKQYEKCNSLLKEIRERDEDFYGPGSTLEIQLDILEKNIQKTKNNWELHLKTQPKIKNFGEFDKGIQKFGGNLQIQLSQDITVIKKLSIVAENLHQFIKDITKDITKGNPDLTPSYRLEGLLGSLGHLIMQESDTQNSQTHDKYREKYFLTTINEVLNSFVEESLKTKQILVENPEIKKGPKIVRNPETEKNLKSQVVALGNFQRIINESIKTHTGYDLFIENKNEKAMVKK